jgi:hypothetical protein
VQRDQEIVYLPAPWHPAGPFGADGNSEAVDGTRGVCIAPQERARLHDHPAT